MSRFELGLKSVQRSLVLLRPDVLVVIDTIQLHPGSGTKKVSAYFQNIMQKFVPYKRRTFHGEFYYCGSFFVTVCKKVCSAWFCSGVSEFSSYLPKVNLS